MSWVWAIILMFWGFSLAVLVYAIFTAEMHDDDDEYI